MAKAQSVDPVKLFVAILWAPSGPLQTATEELIRVCGEIDFTGVDHRFDMTSYYEAEMGGGLQRRLASFLHLVSPENLAGLKHACNDIEDRLAGSKGRRINLDIGYLDHNKIVLASFKGAGQKIYLNNGVWADLVGRYRAGRYVPFEWTFPDFKDGRYDQELLRMRQVYLAQLRQSQRA